MIRENKFSKVLRNTTLIKWLSVPFFLLLSQLLFYYLNPDCICWTYYSERRWDKAAFYLSTAFLMYGGIFLVIIWLSGKIDKRSVFKNNLLGRLLVTTLLIGICMYFFVYLERYIYRMFSVNDFPVTKEIELVSRNYLVVNMVIALFVNSFYNSYMFLKQWKKAADESGKLNDLSHELKEIALQAELKALKLQLDPHFLFNNFSVLTQLINTDKENAKIFLAKLSKVYRYVLACSKKDIVTIEEELEFVQNYFHLMKIRHGQSANLDIDIKMTNRSMGIPPVTLQLLIENAIKHNAATAKNPLNITVSDSQNGFILVKNNLQKINNLNLPASGMGLSNIFERYRLFGDSKPLIVETDSEFEVHLPLLEF